MTEQAKHEASLRFMQLIAVLNLQAMTAMGKLADPATGGEKRDLDEARSAIDLLETLEIKTEGNLTAEESRFLGQVLTDLRLNYVDEVESAGKKAKSPGKDEVPGGGNEETGAAGGAARAGEDRPATSGEGKGS